MWMKLFLFNVKQTHEPETEMYVAGSSFHQAYTLLTEEMCKRGHSHYDISEASLVSEILAK